MSLFHPQPPPPPTLADSFPAALAASLLFQSAAMSVVAGHWTLGFELALLGAALLLARLIRAGLLSKNHLRGLVIATMLTFVAAIFLTLAYFVLRSEFSGDDAEAAQTHRGTGQYRGVILWTEKPPPAAILIAPRLTLEPGREKATDPLTIPFDGVYWFFKFPDHQPPANSYSTTGSPSVLGFRSGDVLPLEMEAHQNFVNLRDLSCCSRITVAITNAERRPGRTEMELILTNQSLPGQHNQTLGRQAVTSLAQRLGETEWQPASETLSFPIPANSRITQFDSATIKFIRFMRTGASSPRIAIDHFTLMPPGQ